MYIQKFDIDVQTGVLFRKHTWTQAYIWCQDLGKTSVYGLELLHHKLIKSLINLI